MTGGGDHTAFSRRALLAAGGAVAAIGALEKAASLLSAPKAEWGSDPLVRAAEREGQVNVYGPVSDRHRQSVERFGVAYPNITLNYTPISGDEFEARYTTERSVNRYLSDIFIGGVGGSVFTDQIGSGWYAPLRPLIVAADVTDDGKWLGGFGSGFVDGPGKYIYAFEADQQNNILIDRNVIPARDLATLEGLFDPRWKGRIASLDPRIQGDQSLTLLFHIFGEEGLRRFLQVQAPVLTRDRRQLQEWAVRGAYPITLGVGPSELAQWQARGLGKSLGRIHIPAGQTPWTPSYGAIALLQNVPHPNAAKVFINLLLSKDAQQDWAVRGLVNSRRLDVPSGLPDTSVSAGDFGSGLTFNSAKLAAEPKRAFEIATEVLG